MRLTLLPLLFAGTSLFGLDAADRTAGSADAPITLEVFSDFQCPHCARLHFGALKEALGDCVAQGRVRIIYRDYPLTQHQYARKAAQYADAAARIGRYERICDALFRTQEAWGRTGDVEGPVAKELTAEEMARLRKILSDPKSTAEINREIDGDMALASQIPLTETPTMILSGGGKRYPIKGDVRYDFLKQLINSLPVK
ncbi:MAG: thioredoxin domain-containing protein [Bryobacteraceae bacterium]